MAPPAHSNVMNVHRNLKKHKWDIPEGTRQSKAAAHLEHHKRHNFINALHDFTISHRFAALLLFKTSCCLPFAL